MATNLITKTITTFQVLEDEERNSSRQGGEDVQILRLDEDTRREETYRRLGDSEILSLDHSSLLAANQERPTHQELANQESGGVVGNHIGAQNVVRAEVQAEGEDKSPG